MLVLQKVYQEVLDTFFAGGRRKTLELTEQRALSLRVASTFSSGDVSGSSRYIFLQEAGKKTFELTGQRALSLRVMLAASLQASYRDCSMNGFRVVLDTFRIPLHAPCGTLELTSKKTFS
jgi:hypothetical protein